MKAVLTYHSVDRSGSPISVSPECFLQHVDWLASGRVRVVPLPELLSVPASEDAVSVTFDDALESFGTIAAPALLERSLPVTVFVVSERVGRTSDWAGTGGRVPVFPILGWPELRRLQEKGVELGAHTRTHPVLTGLDSKIIEDEIVGSARTLEAETGVPPRCFAYPYGIHDPRAVQVARSTFVASVTAELGIVGATVDAHRIPRLDMWYFREPSRLRAWGTPSFHSYLAVRRMGRALKSMVRKRV